MGLGFGPQGRGLRPERPDLRPERPDLRPERPVLRPERLDLRPDEGGMNKQTPCVLQDFVPFRATAQKQKKLFIIRIYSVLHDAASSPIHIR